MEEQTKLPRSTKNSSSQNLKVQRVKNYDAAEIQQKRNKTTLQRPVTKQKASNTKKDFNIVQQKDEAQNTSVDKYVNKPKGERKEPTAWTKTLIGITYLFSAATILYLLQSWWIMIGLVGLAVPVLVFFLAKDEALKKESGKAFFVSACSTVLSMLFWILYISTRGYGIGFLSGLFRGLQITSAVVGAVLIVYFFIEFVTNGKVSIPWIAKITRKTESKIDDLQHAKVKR